MPKKKKRSIDKAHDLLRKKFPDMSFALLAVDGETSPLRADLNLNVSQAVTMIKSSTVLISTLTNLIANNMGREIKTAGEDVNG